MEGVCARFQDDVGDGATGASELGGVVAGAHVNRLNGLCRWDIDLQQPRTLIVIHTLNLQVVEQASLAIHFCRQAVLRIEEFRMHSMRTSSSRHQIHEILEIAVISQGEINHLPAFNLLAHVGAVGLKDRSCRSYYYALGYGPRLKREVHSSVGVHHNIHSGVHDFLESLFLGGDCILTWGNICKFIIPAIISRGTAADTRLHFGGSHLCPCNRAPARIRHRSEQRSVDCLTHDWLRKAKEYYPQHYGHAQPPQFDEPPGGCTTIIHAVHPWEKRTKQFFHDITPLDSKDSSPGPNKNNQTPGTGSTPYLSENHLSTDKSRNQSLRPPF